MRAYTHTHIYIMYIFYSIWCSAVSYTCMFYDLTIDTKGHCRFLVTFFTQRRQMVLRWCVEYRNEGSFLLKTSMGWAASYDIKYQVRMNIIDEHVFIYMCIEKIILDYSSIIMEYFWKDNFVEITIRKESNFWIVLIFFTSSVDIYM